MQIIKKKDVVVFRMHHIDPQSGEGYAIDYHYALKEYEELKELIRKDCNV